MEKSRKNSIDYAQPTSVGDHYELIMKDDSYINTEYAKVSPADLPEWFDEELFTKGQNYFKRNVLGINTGYLAGLIAVFLIPTISKILVFTNQSSTPCTAFKRYFQTLLHMYNLHTCDFKDPKSQFYKSLNTIRWKHSTSSNRAQSNKLTGISQKDMVLTQFGFIGYVLVNPELLALTNEPEERQGINHFWRVNGHLLGIPDNLNLCRKNEHETTLLCSKLIDNVYVKHLKDLRTDFLVLTNAAISGMSCVDPLLDTDAFLYFFYKFNNSKYKKQMSTYSRVNVMYRKSVFYLMAQPIIGVIIRSYWNLYLRMIYWLTEICPIFAWMRYGKENSRINLYPHPAI